MDNILAVLLAVGIVFVFDIFSVFQQQIPGTFIECAIHLNPAARSRVPEIACRWL